MNDGPSTAVQLLMRFIHQQFAHWTHLHVNIMDGSNWLASKVPFVVPILRGRWNGNLFAHALVLYLTLRSLEFTVIVNTKRLKTITSERYLTMDRSS